MKRTERHHLKDNEFARLAGGAREVIETRGRQLIGLALAIVVVIAAVLGYSAWRGMAESRAGALLAEATLLDDARVGPPPAEGGPDTAAVTFKTPREKAQAQLTKFKVVADEYPSTDSGAFARYREGSTRMALGMPKEAAEAFQQVIDHSGNPLYTRMARLALAEAETQSGQFDQAISTYTDLAQRKDDGLPIDGVLIQLARTYRQAGKKSEAEQTLNRVIAEFPGSPFSDDARRELDVLKRS
jgi:TolA-binding protein